MRKPLLFKKKDKYHKKQIKRRLEDEITKKSLKKQIKPE